MTYVNSETPMVGDRIKDEGGRRGTVNSVGLYRGIYELTVKWDGGAVGIRIPITEEFTLITRRASY